MFRRQKKAIRLLREGNPEVDRILADYMDMGASFIGESDPNSQWMKAFATLFRGRAERIEWHELAKACLRGACADAKRGVASMIVIEPYDEGVPLRWTVPRETLGFLHAMLYNDSFRARVEALCREHGVTPVPSREETPSEDARPDDN